MTREDAIHFANCLKNNYTIDLNDIQDFCDEAIKALEQESVIDKIRAEIETKYGQCDICEYDPDYDGRWYQVGDIADILQMIDRHKAEKERGYGLSRTAL